MNRTNIKEEVYHFFDEFTFYKNVRQYRIILSKTHKTSIKVDKNNKLYVIWNCCDDENDERISGHIIHEIVHCIEIDKKYYSFKVYKVKNQSIKKAEFDVDSFEKLYRILCNNAFDKNSYAAFYQEYDEKVFVKSFLEGLAFYYEELYKSNKSNKTLLSVLDHYFQYYKDDDANQMMTYLCGFMCVLILKKFFSKDIDSIEYGKVNIYSYLYNQSNSRK